MTIFDLIKLEMQFLFDKIIHRLKVINLNWIFMNVIRETVNRPHNYKNQFSSVKKKPIVA